MIRVLTIAGALALSVPVGARQQEDERLHFAGIVLAVDAARGALTVEQASAEGPQENFALGDQVSVTYAKTEQGNRARMVKLITSPDAPR